MVKRLSWLILLLVLCSGSWSLAGKRLLVGVKDGPLRSTPTPFGAVVKVLHYGDAVDVLEERKGWSRVLAGNSQGWMHGSLLAARGARLVAGEAGVRPGASPDELTLAGKGFNPQVEAEYRKQNRSLDYATVDRMEKIKVSAEEVGRFVAEGGLSPDGGDHGR